jgi:predicted  nucleic acid-binding Zn-ribbon protein
LFGSLLLFGVAGCDTKVSQREVESQRDKVARLEDKVQDLRTNKEDHVEAAAEDAKRDTRKEFEEEIKDTQRELREEKEELVALDERRAFEGQMQDRLNDMDEKIDALSDRAAATEDEAKKRDLEQQIAEFKLRRDAMQKDLDNLRAESGDLWSQMKLSLESTWDEASRQVNTAIDEVD